MCIRDRYQRRVREIPAESIMEQALTADLERVAAESERLYWFPPNADRVTQWRVRAEPRSDALKLGHLAVSQRFFGSESGAHPGWLRVRSEGITGWCKHSAGAVPGQHLIRTETMEHAPAEYLAQQSGRSCRYLVPLTPEQLLPEPAEESAVCWPAYAAARESCCKYLYELGAECRVLFLSVGCFVDDDSVDMFKEQNAITQQLPCYVLHAAERLAPGCSAAVVLVDGKFADRAGEPVLPKVLEARSLWSCAQDSQGPCYSRDNIAMRPFPFWFNCASQQPLPGEFEPPNTPDEQLCAAVLAAAERVAAQGGVVLLGDFVAKGASRFFEFADEMAEQLQHIAERYPGAVLCTQEFTNEPRAVLQHSSCGAALHVLPLAPEQVQSSVREEWFELVIEMAQGWEQKAALYLELEVRWLQPKASPAGVPQAHLFVVHKERPLWNQLDDQMREQHSSWRLEHLRLGVPKHCAEEEEAAPLKRMMTVAQLQHSTVQLTEDTAAQEGLHRTATAALQGAAACDAVGMQLPQGYVLYGECTQFPQ
eukprot:TRINITY_DN5466_c0_g2_i1.p1 TRINITY_DN5466_c0_g2~~TRINITY_DN5466_c0_g2_i1.p1  ORF type:complete len:538 (+),score=188.48 TRINITY_DN5466_c0_g2_i1:106-1719(+)